MLMLLHRPLTLDRVAMVMTALLGAVIVYCLTYSGLAGQQESVVEALAWAIIHVAPWFAAFEAAKRRPGVSTASAALAIAFIGSIALGAAWNGTFENAGFEAVRRVPGALLVAALLMIGRLAAPPRAARPGDGPDLPIDPSQIDWIAAAGNYLEIKSRGRTLIVRTPLREAERQLAQLGFVRIHRSTLVRRDRIARVRPADVILVDGTILKTGKRYRAALDA